MWWVQAARRAPVFPGIWDAVGTGGVSWDPGVTSPELIARGGGFGSSRSLSLGRDAGHTWVPVTPTTLASGLEGPSWEETRV